jgi:endoglucanase
MLMPGGTCESSVYCSCGFSATGLCLALGNYHNMGPEGKPAPEEISFSDYENLVKLMETVVSSDGNPQAVYDEWMNENNKRFDRLKEYL